MTLVKLSSGEEVVPALYGAQVLTCRTCKIERIFVFDNRQENGYWFKGTCGHVRWVDA